MPRGRPAGPKAPTKFLNSKKRVIYMTSEGKFLAKSDKGKTVYNPKAHHVKSPGGTVRTIANSKARVPTAIRAKVQRKPRSNRGAARGPRAYKSGNTAFYKKPIGPMPMRMRGRPRKHLVSPGGNMGLAALFGGKPVRAPHPRKLKAANSLGPVKRDALRRMARKQRLAHKKLIKKLTAPLN